MLASDEMLLRFDAQMGWAGGSPEVRQEIDGRVSFDDGEGRARFT